MLRTLKALSPPARGALVRALGRPAPAGARPSWGGIQFQPVTQVPQAAMPLPPLLPALRRSLGSLTSSGFLMLFPGNVENIWELLHTPIGFYIFAGIHIAFRGCMYPAIDWVDRLAYIEAATFISYGLFFIGFASTPFMYFIWFFMLFTNGLKTLLIVHLTDPLNNPLEVPLRVQFTLKRQLQ